MEQQIREEQGLPEMTPVAIPDSGIIPLSEDPLLEELQQERTDNPILALEEVEAWVQDQEER